MFKTILVALDGSDHANHALTVAMDLAEKYSANLVLLTVYHPVYLPVLESDYAMAKVQQSYFETQQTRCEHVLSDARKHVIQSRPSLQVATMLMEGRPANTIIETAQQGSVDLIVMGSRGVGGVKQLVLGSVSDRVADGAPCPVLIVR